MILITYRVYRRSSQTSIISSIYLHLERLKRKKERDRVSYLTNLSTDLFLAAKD